MQNRTPILGRLSLSLSDLSLFLLLLILTPLNPTFSILLSLSLSHTQIMTIAAVDETDYNLWLDALSDTLEIREMAIQVTPTAFLICFPDGIRTSLSLRLMPQIKYSNKQLSYKLCRRVSLSISLFFIVNFFTASLPFPCFSAGRLQWGIQSRQGGERTHQGAEEGRENCGHQKLCCVQRAAAHQEC